MQLSTPIPPCLTKHGIRMVRDNLQPGQEIGGLAGEIARLFGAELLEAMQCESNPETETSLASPSPRLRAS
ncbi:hypothetical protein [Chromobacterium haemolyticum]|uniref:hypothetical protein n=1 Tax=Chromobacterium haemolyticum TaxID=394935 RepID=UPI000DEFFE5A|nr:hypothetical protein [Chromobacterium haemolyticum]